MLIAVNLALYSTWLLKEAYLREIELHLGNQSLLLRYLHTVKAPTRRRVKVPYRPTVSQHLPLPPLTAGPNLNNAPALS